MAMKSSDLEILRDGVVMRMEDLKIRRDVINEVADLIDSIYSIYEEEHIKAIALSKIMKKKGFDKQLSEEEVENAMRSSKAYVQTQEPYSYYRH